MPQHIHTGKKGEDLAVDWLTRNGYNILHRNWRHGRYEIDIIATRDKILHIIEVKCRTSHAFGPPEGSVDRKKIQHILRSTSGWLYRHPGHQRVQYDVLAITLHTPANPEYFFIQDVYL